MANHSIDSLWELSKRQAQGNCGIDHGAKRMAMSKSGEMLNLMQMTGADITLYI